MYMAEIEKVLVKEIEQRCRRDGKKITVPRKRSGFRGTAFLYVSYFL